MRLLTLFRVSSRISRTLKDSEGNVGYNAFAGQGHRIRSPTPGEGNARGTDLPARPGGGVGLADHALPTVPVRADASRADRHPIHPDRERADSRSRRALALPDRSHSPHEGCFPKQGCG